MVKSGAIFLILLSLFSSALAQASGEKILYHLHQVGPENYARAMSNLENLKKGMPDKKLEIKLLLQGNSIGLLYPTQDAKIKKRLGQLRDGGLQVEVSRGNFYKNRHYLDLNNPPNLVQNIFTRIVELEKQGYQYITP